MMKLGRALAALSFVAGSLSVAACSNTEQPEFSPLSPREQAQRDRYGTITGSGITLFSTQNPDRPAPGAPSGGGGVGVNAYLWRGALETIDFMPLVSADPFGGLIITDWFQPVENPDERIRLQVLIRDTVLRADGVKVTVLRQQRRGGEWLDVPADPQTATALEDKILTRARELRVAGLEGQ
jgi:hypothetical protein